MLRPQRAVLCGWRWWKEFKAQRLAEMGAETGGAWSSALRTSRFDAKCCASNGVAAGCRGVGFTRSGALSFLYVITIRSFAQVVQV